MANITDNISPAARRTSSSIIGFFAVLLIAAGLASAAQSGRPADGGSTAADVKARVECLLASFPADNGAAMESLAEDLLALGPEATKDVCLALSPAGAADDSRARFALNAMAVCAARSGREKYRPVFVKDILAFARTAIDGGIRDFLITQAAIAGQAEAVKPLAAFLAVPDAAGPAARALQSIGGPEAGRALLGALAKADAKTLPDIIQAAGGLKRAGLAGKLLPYASSSDAAVRLAARRALAAAGDPAAGPVLSISRIEAPYAERKEAAGLYLAYARALAANGHAREALAAARTVHSSYIEPGETHIAAEAFELIFSLLGETDAAAAVVAELDRPAADLRAVALELSDRLKADVMVPGLIAKAGSVGPETRAAVIAHLARRADPRVLPLVKASLGDADPTVRLAAIEAVRGSWVRELLPVLFDLAGRSEDDSELAAVRTSARCFGRDDIVPLIRTAMPSATVQAKALFIGLLGEKAAAEEVETVFAAASSAEPEIRAAACRALAGTAGPSDLPRLINLLAGATDSGDIKSLENAAAAAAARDASREEAAARLLALARTAPEDRLIPLMKVLPYFGGDGALAFVAERSRDKEPKVKASALAVLSRWPQASATAELLRAVKEADSRKNLLMALEGYVRLVNGSKEPAWKKYLLFKDALDALKDDADKAVVLRGLAAFRDPWSLKMLAAYLDHPLLGTTAASSLLELASEQAPEERWLSGQAAISCLRKVEAISPAAEDQARVAAIISDRLRQGGFVPLFNGRDLDGWKGLVADPPARAKMTPAGLAAAQADADGRMRSHWRVDDGVLVFDGKGESLCTRKDYADFELLVDWKIDKAGDSGIYLRGSPQVQIWDPRDNPVGSGGLYNNQKGPSKPLAVADNAVGQWNNFRVIMIGDRVTVYLNDKMVVEDTVLENYWERGKPIYPVGQIELQAHGNPLWFRNVWIREIPRDAAAPGLDEFEKDDGFRPLFDGRTLDGWTGVKEGYTVENGNIIVVPEKAGGNLYTEGEFTDFVLRFEFKLHPAANNGIGVRAPLEGDAAYTGMEIQVLEDGSPVYWDLHPYQYHGSVYGVVPARRGELVPLGEWNKEEITVKGRRVRVVVNDMTIVDADLDAASTGGTIDGNPHPGLNRTSGHLGLLGHGSRVEFRNIRIKELK